MLPSHAGPKTRLDRDRWNEVEQCFALLQCESMLRLSFSLLERIARALERVANHGKYQCYCEANHD